jgi:hypothetical protein
MELRPPVTTVGEFSRDWRRSVERGPSALVAAKRRTREIRRLDVQLYARP